MCIALQTLEVGLESDARARPENGGEAFDIALASRIPKVLLVSTEAPFWILRLTKNATQVPLNE